MTLPWKYRIRIQSHSKIFDKMVEYSKGEPVPILLKVKGENDPVLIGAQMQLVGTDDGVFDVLVFAMDEAYAEGKMSVGDDISIVDPKLLASGKIVGLV